MMSIPGVPGAVLSEKIVGSFVLNVRLAIEENSTGSSPVKERVVENLLPVICIVAESAPMAV